MATPCACSVAVTGTRGALRGRKGCPRCGGSGLLPPPRLTPEAEDVLRRGGWSRDGADCWTHELHGTGRTEAALDLAARDLRGASRRAAE